MSYLMLEEDLFEIAKVVNAHKTLLEFGSGFSTRYLGEHTQSEVYTVEHNLEFWISTERHPRCKYLYCHIKDGSYDMDFITGLNINPDIVLVDGPPGALSKESRRAPFEWAINCNSCTTIILDDIDREDEKSIIRSFESQLDLVYLKRCVIATKK